MTRSHRYKYTLLFAWFLIFRSLPVWANENDRVTEFKQRSKNSAAVLKVLTTSPEGIPIEILNSAKAIAVFPNVFSAKTWLGGKTEGKGIVSRRSSVGWTAPASFELDKNTGPGLGF